MENSFPLGARQVISHTIAIEEENAEFSLADTSSGITRERKNVQRVCATPAIRPVRWRCVLETACSLRRRLLALLGVPSRYRLVPQAVRHLAFPACAQSPSSAAPGEPDPAWIFFACVYGVRLLNDMS